MGEEVDRGQGKLVKLEEMLRFFFFCSQDTVFVCNAKYAEFVKTGRYAEVFCALGNLGNTQGALKVVGGWHTVAQRPLTWHVFSIKNISTNVARASQIFRLIVWGGVLEYSLL